MQKAYWIGRSGTFDLGHIGCHVYLEVKLAAHDSERLQAAWQMLIEHHDMLRAIVREDGRQQILVEVPRYKIEHRDLGSAEAASARAEVEAIRQRMSHQVFRPDRWPLFEVRTTELDSGTLLHLSIDLLFIDFWSIQLLVKEYMQLVSDPDPYLPPLDLSFRDYVLFTARQREHVAGMTATSPEIEQWIVMQDVFPQAIDRMVCLDRTGDDMCFFVVRIFQLTHYPSFFAAAHTVYSLNIHILDASINLYSMNPYSLLSIQFLRDFKRKTEWRDD